MAAAIAKWRMSSRLLPNIGYFVRKLVASANDRRVVQQILVGRLPSHAKVVVGCIKQPPAKADAIWLHHRDIEGAGG